MAKAVIVILHFNSDYAEIPQTELPNVVSSSYEPTVRALERLDEGTVCMSLTGNTLDYLLAEAPELVRRIGDLVQAQRIEVVACGYSHPVLPLLPVRRIRDQIRAHIEQIRNVFGTSPIGFWPPELAISPAVLHELSQLGIRWTAVDYEHYLLANTIGNDFNPFEMRTRTTVETLVDAYWAKGLVAKIRAYRKTVVKLNRMMKTQHKGLARVQVGEQTSIGALLSSVSWSLGTLFALSDTTRAYSRRKHLSNVLHSGTDYVPLYCYDVEFWGYIRRTGIRCEPQAFVSLLEELKDSGMDLISPSQIPEKEWPTDTEFVGSGSWAPDKSLRIWTDSADNRELMRRMQEVYAFLERLEWDDKTVTNVERLLRIAENSDCHGWSPRVEKKHAAYCALLEAYEILQGDGRR